MSDNKLVKTVMESATLTKTYIRRGRAETHRDQAIVERFNRTLAERLFGHQYAVEMLLPEGQGQPRGSRGCLMLSRR